MYHLAFFFIDLQMTYSYKDFFLELLFWGSLWQVVLKVVLIPPKCHCPFEGCLKICSVGLCFKCSLFWKGWLQVIRSFFLSCVEMRLLEFHWRLSLFKNKVFSSQSFSLFLVNTYCFTHHQQLIQWTRRWGVVI